MLGSQESLSVIHLNIHGLVVGDWIESLLKFVIASGSTSYWHFCSLTFQDAFSRQPRQIRTRWEGFFPPGCPEARMTFVIWTFHILFPIIHHFIPTKDPHYSGKKSQKSSHGQNERGWECIWKSNWIHFVLLLPPGTSAGFRHWGWGVSKHLQPHRVRGGGVWQPEVQFDIERVSSTDMNSPSSGGQEVTPSRALFHLYPICTFELTSKWIDV